MVAVHIFCFYCNFDLFTWPWFWEQWPAFFTQYPLCDLDLGCNDLKFARDIPPYNGEHMCQVILKSLYAFRSFALDQLIAMNTKCDLEVSPRNLVYARNIAFHWWTFLWSFMRIRLFVKEIFFLNKFAIFNHL
jgi:hypothetical protein